MDSSSGAVLIAPEVLTTVVRQVAETTPGVARLGTGLPRHMARVFRASRQSSGLQVEVTDGAVSIDLYLVAMPNTMLLQLGQTLQREIYRAISDVVGMPVRTINIHIVDVEGPFAAASPPPPS